MNIINKVGDTISQSVDFIIDKNRQAAYLNRLKAIIVVEQETLNQAYITLGKMYLGVIEGKEKKEPDTASIVESINATKLRLKKARARYEYTLKYGVPKPGVKAEEVIEVPDEDAADDRDITIAYADPTAAIDNDALDAVIDECVEDTVVTDATEEE